MIDRREFLQAAAALVAANAVSDRGLRPLFPTAVARPVPSPSQLLWQTDELAIFLHFGVNTFTDREWGDGTESPAIFNPVGLDARQWIQRPAR